MNGQNEHGQSAIRQQEEVAKHSAKLKKKENHFYNCQFYYSVPPTTANGTQPEKKEGPNGEDGKPEQTKLAESTWKPGTVLDSVKSKESVANLKEQTFSTFKRGSITQLKASNNNLNSFQNMKNASFSSILKLQNPSIQNLQAERKGSTIQMSKLFNAGAANQPSEMNLLSPLGLNEGVMRKSSNISYFPKSSIIKNSNNNLCE